MYLGNNFMHFFGILLSSGDIFGLYFINMRVFHPSCAGTVLQKSGCSEKEVPVGCTGPEGDAS